MAENICTNLRTCPLVNKPLLPEEPERREVYLQTYCFPANNKYLECRRYIFKLKYGFCPDFLMPDSVMCEDEVLDRYEEM
ncbi:MAG TPA: hypothetical protein P5531_03320 [Bacteroidales bacterium]|nr:hypothetical protein [Bacteroidales bacterium]HSA42450.1 hypothetical protein [Bacteroidales bacterium]